MPAPRGDHAASYPPGALGTSAPPPRRKKRKPASQPQGEHAATHRTQPAGSTSPPRRPATPTVTEHTHGQAGPVPGQHERIRMQYLRDLSMLHGALNRDLGNGWSLGHNPVAMIDRLAGSPVESINALITDPRGTLFPQPQHLLAGRRGGWESDQIAPLEDQPINVGMIPYGPTKGLRGFSKTARAARKAERAAALPEPPSVAGAQVKAALPGARIVRGKQEAGYSAERARRAKEAAAIMRDNPGIEGHRAALDALRGELPKINFGGFQELTPDALDALAKHVHEHPHLMPFQKITAVSALEHAATGKVPTNSELKLLTNIFGKDTARGLTKVHTLPDHIKNVVIEALNVPRSIMASFDLSAPFRQGLMAGARHPVIFARNFKPMIQSFGREGAYQAVEQEIAARPTFHMMNAAKLAITDLEKDNLTNREENLFGYGMAEKIPVAGHAIRGSARAYNAFLTKMRADVFDHLIQGFEAQGIDVQNEEFLKALGKYINSSTGRGDLGFMQGAAPYLNTVFFSPRLLASRLNFLSPVYYARLPAPVRKEALRAALQLTGLVGTTLGLAGLAGAKVGHDPRNADFAKIRLGNTRLDVLGGFQQPIRLLSQLVSGKIISSTTGDPLTLGPQGPGAISRRDIVQRFFEGKLAPVPSVVNDAFKGTNFQGRPFSWKQETYQHMIPLLAQDAADLYGEQQGGVNGIAAAVGGYGLGAFGVGLQTYASSASKKSVPKPDKVNAWIAQAEKVDGHPMDAQDRRAATTKVVYDTQVKRLKDDLGVKKLTDKQRAAVKLEILIAESHMDPGGAKQERDYLRAITDSDELSRQTGYYERTLGWDSLLRYSAYIKRSGGKSWGDVVG